MIVKRALMQTSLVVALLALGTAAARADVKVVSSILPVSALATAVMEGVGTSETLVPAGRSPHGYALAPSDARKLSQADVVFYVGPDMETFLEKPLETLAGDARVIALIEAEGLRLLDNREIEDFGRDDHDDHGHKDHDHDSHGHKDHDDHGHKGHDDHAHDDHAHKDHDHDSHGHKDHEHKGHAHDHGEHDPHIWLDPDNAVIVARAMAETLARVDAANAGTYLANAEAVATRLAALQQTIDARLTPVRGKSYISFHDGYQYFETAFGLRAVGVLTMNPDIPPGARHLSDLRKRVAEENVECIFFEPQFAPASAQALADATGAKASFLDPIGPDDKSGFDQYAETLTDIADNLANCLGDGK